jgi:N-acetylmuramoyl-L-alanine amidase
MDFHSALIRDRRVAASDEALSVAGSQIFGRGSNARGYGTAGRASDRQPSQISTIILHQTAGAMVHGLDVISADDQVRSRHRVDRIAAHFVVTVDGQVFYLHDIEYIMNNAGGRRGIDIEFCGRYGAAPVPSGARLSSASIAAGRKLVRLLMESVPSIRHIHPHGQVQATPASHDREPGPKFHSCCGPDIWVNVGMWAAATLGLATDTTAAGYPNHGISPRQANVAYRL